MISHSFILTALVRPLVTEAFWRYPVEKPQTSAHSTGFLLKMFWKMWLFFFTIHSPIHFFLKKSQF